MRGKALGLRRFFRWRQKGQRQIQKISAVRGEAQYIVTSQQRDGRHDKQRHGVDHRPRDANPRRRPVFSALAPVATAETGFGFGPAGRPTAPVAKTVDLPPVVSSRLCRGSADVAAFGVAVADPADILATVEPCAAPRSRATGAGRTDRRRFRQRPGWRPTSRASATSSCPVVGDWLALRFLRGRCADLCRCAVQDIVEHSLEGVESLRLGDDALPAPDPLAGQRLLALQFQFHLPAGAGNFGLHVQPAVGQVFVRHFDRPSFGQMFRQIPDARPGRSASIATASCSRLPAPARRSKSGLRFW